MCDGGVRGVEVRPPDRALLGGSLALSAAAAGLLPCFMGMLSSVKDQFGVAAIGDTCEIFLAGRRWRAHREAFCNTLRRLAPLEDSSNVLTSPRLIAGVTRSTGPRRFYPKPMRREAAWPCGSFGFRHAEEGRQQLTKPTSKRSTPASVNSTVSRPRLFVHRLPTRGCGGVARALPTTARHGRRGPGSPPPRRRRRPCGRARAT